MLQFWLQFRLQFWLQFQLRNVKLVKICIYSWWFYAAERWIERLILPECWIERWTTKWFDLNDLQIHRYYNPNSYLIALIKNFECQNRVRFNHTLLKCIWNHDYVADMHLLFSNSKKRVQLQITMLRIKYELKSGCSSRGQNSKVTLLHPLHPFAPAAPAF